MTLSVARKADRLTIATRLVAIATERGATACIKEGQSYPGPKGVLVAIETSQGVEVGIVIDGDKRTPAGFVLPWYVGRRHGVELTGAFGFVAGAEVNPHHGLKCTAVAWDVEELFAKVDACLGLLAGGRGTKAARA